MVPESAHRSSGNVRVVEAASMIVEHGEFVLGHHVPIRVGLDPVPDIPNGFLERCVGRRRHAFALAVPNELKCSLHGKLTTHL